MKILLVHNFYQSSAPSGEDAAFRAEVELLKQHGVKVLMFEKHNDNAKPGIDAAVNMIWSRQTYRELSAIVYKEKPDVAHFHNIWYLISPSAYYACKDAGVPVVQTLHNFRIFCANGLLMRNGHICEKCVGRSPWNSVFYGCYRSSRLYSIPVAFTEWVHRVKETWANTIDAYITLTEFGKLKFIEAGLPTNKLFVKPNFLLNPPKPSYVKSDYVVFMGRLSEEKGIVTLINAARTLLDQSLSIKVIGTGPLHEEYATTIKTAHLTNIELLGRKSSGDCFNLLLGAKMLIMPSISYETFGLTIVEAFACGKPVIASNHGAMAAIVEHGKTGLLFEPGNAEDLASKIRWMVGNPDACIEMGKNARAEFEAKYTAEKNFEILMDIYRRVLSKKQ